MEENTRKKLIISENRQINILEKIFMESFFLRCSPNDLRVTHNLIEHNFPTGFSFFRTY